VTRSEHGQTTLLLVGFAVVALLMVGVVVDASAAYLRRQGLDTLADGAALAAADGIQGRQVYETGLGERAGIDPALAQALVADYIAASTAVQEQPGLRYAVDASADRIVVRIWAPLDLPITPPGWAERPVISATAASYVVVAD
jgi:uncharacterized membrane protein